MADTYQAIYDAVRSRIGSVNPSEAFENVLRETNLTWYAERIASAAADSFTELSRPCYAMKPKLYPDGDSWCALYGENLQEGVAGFGDTPEEAFRNFDKNFRYQSFKRQEQQNG